jgi:hypothetical protein
MRQDSMKLGSNILNKKSSGISTADLNLSEEDLLELRKKNIRRNIASVTPHQQARLANELYGIEQRLNQIKSDKISYKESNDYKEGDSFRINKEYADDSENTVFTVVGISDSGIIDGISNTGESLTIETDKLHYIEKIMRGY